MDTHCFKWWYNYVMIKRVLFFFSATLCVVLGLGMFLPITEAAFDRNLTVGMSGNDVRELQQLLNADSSTRVAVYGAGSPGNESDYFGNLTKAAVIRFQEKYASEVLAPVGLVRGSGFVGLFSRMKLSGMIALKNSQLKPPVAIIPPVATSSSPSSNPPVVKPNIVSVSPSHLRTGDTVTISGSGFLPTGNTVIFADGPVNQTFSNIPSPDGKTLSFVFKAPPAPGMTLAELRALPSNILAQIEGAVTGAGGTLEDVAHPFRFAQSEADIEAFLQKNGRSLADLDGKFYVTVQNKNGFYYKPDLTVRASYNFSTQSSFSRSLKEKALSFSRLFSPMPLTTNAQVYGGGINMSIVMICTCSGGYMTVMSDFAAGGSGLYWFPPGFVPLAGTGLPFAFWLGSYVPGGGVCAITAGPFCATITGNLPIMYGGSN